MTKNKNPSGFLCRLEPDNLQWVHEFPRFAKMMRDVGWFPFYERLKGHNVQVTRAFVKNYKDSVVWFEYLQIRVDEDVIAEAIGVQSDGENGLSSNRLKPIIVNSFFQGLRSWIGKMTYILVSLSPCGKRH